MEDIYSNRSRWKILLGIAGLIIVLITLFYSNYLATKLQENEKNNVELYAAALKSLVKESQETGVEIDYTLNMAILERYNSIPVILESDAGVLIGENFSDSTINDQVFLAAELEQIKKSGFTPIKGPAGYANMIYYKNSPLYNRIRYFPIVTVLLLGVFILFAYYLFNASRVSEQNRVWAGMAKETAHQLGTPISAIMAWIEHLKEILGDDPDQQEIITELTKDVNRLDLVADRFSKIGSAPKLVEIDLYAQLDECKEYMEKRASRKIVFDFDKGSGKNVMINEHLFNWVIENLIRNALDAMGGTGKISTIVYEENNYFCLDLTDTGKGIATSKFKTIFQPGYSTKSRGWGLGLSLAKRIIENYHSGKIYVKNSTPNQETTFTIKLPKATK